MQGFRANILIAKELRPGYGLFNISAPHRSRVKGQQKPHQPAGLAGYTERGERGDPCTAIAYSTKPAGRKSLRPKYRVTLWTCCNRLPLSVSLQIARVVQAAGGTPDSLRSPDAVSGGEVELVQWRVADLDPSRPIHSPNPEAVELLQVKRLGQEDRVGQEGTNHRD